MVSYAFGFYYYIPQSKSNEVQYNTLILESKTAYSNGDSAYKRNSVFSFTYDPGTENEMTYTCGTAIFLQVVYAILILASIIVIIKYRPKQLNELKKDGE